MKKFIFVFVAMTCHFHIIAQNAAVDNITSQAATAMADGKVYSYQFKSYALGKLAKVFPVTTGAIKVVLQPNDFSGALQKARLLARDPRGTTNVVINDGVVYKIDNKAKKVYRTPRYRAASSLFDENILLPVYSLKDLKNASQKQGKLIKTTTYNDINCQVVNIRSEGKLNLSFWLGKQDHLIYKVEATTPVYAGSTLVMEFSDVKTGQPINESDFQLPKLEGYTTLEYSGKYPAIGSMAQDWTVTDYNGNSLQLSSLKGKVVLLDFWATWCRPCLQSMPHLQKLADKYQKQGLKVIGLTAQEQGNPQKRAKKMARKLKIRYTIADGEAVAKQYKINGLPFALVIGKDGKVVDFFNGYLGSETDQIMEKVVKKALRQD